MAVGVSLLDPRGAGIFGGVKNGAALASPLLCDGAEWRGLRTAPHMFTPNMDLLFDCPSCTGPLIAAEVDRGAPAGCAHCGGRVFVPPGAHRARAVALLRDSEIMAVHPQGGERPRVLRRVRPAAPETARPIIASSARIMPAPLPRPGVSCAA